MQRTGPVKSIVATTSAPAAAIREIRPLAEGDAAQAMWVYYRDNKAQLITDIKEYRSTILSQLMVGLPVEQVFAPFARPVAPARPMKRAA